MREMLMSLATMRAWQTLKQVINIRGTMRPQIEASIDMPGEAHRVHVAGERAYVAGGSGGL
jgi:hypothetical protein